MSRYAEGTSVSAEKSRMEIETVLRRYGAEGFGYASMGRRAIVQFQAKGRAVRFVLELPDPADKRFVTFERHRRQYKRTPDQARAAWEQECRRVWRALALTIKAKLEAVESGISIFEAEFLAHIVLPGGKLVGEVVLPEIARAYETGEPPQLLLGMGEQ